MEAALTLSAILALAGCNNHNQSSDEKSIRIALNDYLQNEQPLCLITPNLPNGLLTEGPLISNAASRETLALHQIGLLSRTSSHTADNIPITQYRLSKSAMPYVKKIERKTFGLQGTKIKTENRICYGEKTLSRIIEKQPASLSNNANQVLISYTYEINNLAEWTRENSFLEAFPDIREIIEGIDKKEERKVLRRTDKSWTVIDN
jgi:hypothetical protein